MAGGFLTEFERQSALWLKLKQYLDSRRAGLHARIERPLSTEKTNALRGQIAELKHFLSLADDKPAPAPEDELFKD